VWGRDEKSVKYVFDGLMIGKEIWKNSEWILVTSMEPKSGLRDEVMLPIVINHVLISSC
jgi:hypothetical protein